MITNNASAEFGNFQGGVINVVIKSGTNEFHGTVFEIFRNDKFNANSWARNWTVGGIRAPDPLEPVRRNHRRSIKKDKLFFFADYQGLRRATAQHFAASVFLPDSAKAISQTLDPANPNGGIQLYDPYSADGTGARTPFPNNQIPITRSVRR